MRHWQLCNSSVFRTANPIWLKGPDYCPLKGHNPGFLLACLLDITTSEGNSTCRKCGTEEETSGHILCECEDLASLRHTYLGSFFLDREDIRKQVLGAIWNFAKGTELL